MLNSSFTNANAAAFQESHFPRAVDVEDSVSDEGLSCQNDSYFTSHSLVARTSVAIGLSVLLGILVIDLVARRLSAELDMYVFRPLVWTVPGIIAIVALKGHRNLLVRNVSLLIPAITIGVATVMLSMSLGVLYGFGYSPYMRDISDLLPNVWFVSALIIPREIARWYIVRTLAQRSELLAFGVGWGLFWISSLSLRTVLNLSNSDQVVSYVGGVVLPSAGLGMLATYFALRGSPLAAISYATVVVLAEWTLPVLPDLPWLTIAFVGVAVPVIALAILQPTEVTLSMDDSEPVGPSWSVIALATLGVGLFWFNTGMFGVQPALINGHSMEPSMHTGDIAVIRDVEPRDLRVGDVIKFSERGHFVLHRIIEIQDDGGSLVFITQGDNNPIADDPVSESAIVGRHVVTIPKAGWIGIGAKKALGAVMP